MYKNENNLICLLKTAVFMLFCLLAFSSGANRDSDYDSFRGNVLTAKVQPLDALAILNPAIDRGAELQTIITHDNKSQLRINNKLAFDSRLFNQRFITLRRSRENIIPLHRFRYYLPVLPANHDDLPDLS